MKILKSVLVVCGVVGLVALIAPLSGRSLLKEYFMLDWIAALVYAAIFVLPATMGALALARPPMRSWQAGVALSGCVIGVVRFRIWEIAMSLPSAGLRSVLVLAAIVVGTAASATMLLRPEAGEPG